MIQYRAPQIYCAEAGALSRAGELIASNLGKRLFLIAGKTARARAEERLFPALQRAGISYTIEEYGGSPTYAAAKRFAAAAREAGADAVAGLGGGRILDTAKAAGTYAGVPVAALPTIAATCACWAAVSVMYDEEGVAVEPLFNEASPRLVIADLDLISRAPARYLRSGIADTLAKWYEAYPNLRTSNDFYLRLAVSYGKFARDILENTGAAVADALERGEFAAGADTETLREVVDCVFAVAGLCGAVRTIADTQGIAHPFYNAASALPPTRALLHGEKVAFGLVVQGVLEGRGEAELAHRIAVFKKLKMPLTLREQRLEPDFERNFAELKQRLRRSTPRYAGLTRDWSADELRAAFLGASERAAENAPPAAYKTALDGIAAFKPARSLESAKRGFGLTNILKLAGNENLHGTSPRVIEALERSYGELAYYPDTAAACLRDALAGKLGLAPDELLFSNGSFELISIAALAALEDGDAALIQTLSRVRSPVNVNALAQTAALAALEDDAFYRRVLAENERGRTLYYAELARLGLGYLPTACNFIMFDTGRDAASVELSFLKQGILVRNGAEFGMPTWLRVTIGTEEHNRRVIAILEAIR